MSERVCMWESMLSVNGDAKINYGTELLLLIRNKNAEGEIHADENACLSFLDCSASLFFPNSVQRDAFFILFATVDLLIASVRGDFFSPLRSFPFNQAE